MNKSIIVNIQTVAISILLLFSYHLFGGWMFFYAIIQLIVMLRNLLKSTEMIEGKLYIYGEHDGNFDRHQIKIISLYCIIIIIFQILISLFPLYYMIDEIFLFFAEHFDIYINQYEGGNVVWVLLMSTEAASLLLLWIFIGKYLDNFDQHDFSQKYSLGKYQFTKANVIQTLSIGFFAILVMIVSVYIMGTYTDIGSASTQDQRIHHLQRYY